MSSSTRQCQKCHHVKEQASMNDLEACPKCGGIYSRVEAHLRASQDRAGTPSKLPTATRRRPTNANNLPDHREFAVAMRAQSLYPNFRALVKIFQWLTYLIALAIGISGVISGGVATLIAIGVAIFLAVMATVAKEATLMMADIGDATVLNAAANSSLNTTQRSDF